MVNDDRRRFLTICLGGLAAASAATVSWPVYRYLAPRKHSVTEDKVAIPVQEVLPGEARFFEFAGSAAVLVRKVDGTLLALSAICTHLGCIVQWEKEKQTFLCPCHAGRFTAEGVVISGPPPSALAKLPFTEANGTITIG